MARLTRAQQQERTRAAVLAAARAEFAERGYTDAKIDRIAERAELTRGAVYSNFPSKRALYLAVLLDTPAGASGSTHAGAHVGTTDGALSTTGDTYGGGIGGSHGGGIDVLSPAGLGEALGAFARVWLERLPLVGDTPAGGKLQARSLAGVFDDEPGRSTLAQIGRLEALLLALALEPRLPHHPRRVRTAELVLTLLHGAGHLAETAPGFGDPFDVASACAHLAGLDLADTWDPPYLAFVPAAPRLQEDWTPPAGLPDLISGRPAVFDADGVIAVLGTSRLEAAEEAVRAAGPGEQVTLVVVTDDPAEIGRLVRLRAGDLMGCLRRVFGPDVWPSLSLVLDDGTIAAATGVGGNGDATEAAVRVQAGTITARATGRGAAHAVATAARPAVAGQPTTDQPANTGQFTADRPATDRPATTDQPTGRPAADRRGGGR
ncbi:regulatory protein, tetR family [Nonomuraea solani]|uniref:Regulatory protein, tetR family n=1 Tax=Nonomuraea solani TaxID=1144553 RepID=A0A1H6EG54_9ACTN|nr:TetR/AcrR family transcriptional regulator [Nonomuraea solani]SEG96752.1 regulatory protein, tetR family [Nonomuraea solani]